MLCTATPDISGSRENINSMAHVSRLSFCFFFIFPWKFFLRDKNNKFILIVCIGVSTPLKNTTPLFLAKPPFKSANCPSTPFLDNPPPPPPSVSVFHELPPLKVEFVNGHPKYQNFSSLTQSYLLIVTKFLVKITQFEFLVMTEKNIFVYKLYLSLNIS